MSGTRIGFEAGDVEVAGRPFDPLDKGPPGYIHVVADDYFRMMKIPVLRGRVLTEMDAVGPVGSVKNVVINETMARRFWPDEDALGKRFRFYRIEDFPWVAVVGSVGDAAYSGLDRDISADIYYPERNFPQSAITMLIRTTVDPWHLVSAVRSAVHKVNRHAFVTDVKTMEQILSDSQSHRRFTMFLLTVFSVIALGLAVTGIYGVTAYSVAQRNLELGIRAALGARPTDLIRLVLKRGLVQILLGIAVGLVAAVAAGRLLAAMLYAVTPTDPATVAVVVALITSAAVAACYLPARRASRVDPKQVLRSE